MSPEPALLCRTDPLGRSGELCGSQPAASDAELYGSRKYTKLLGAELPSYVFGALQAAGATHSAAVTSAGFLFTWGANSRGQLGLPAAAEVAAHHQVRSSMSRAGNAGNSSWRTRVLTTTCCVHAHACPAFNTKQPVQTMEGLSHVGSYGMPAGEQHDGRGIPVTPCVAVPPRQSQFGLEERRRVRRTANQRFLGAMLDMGIPQDHAELALAETGNVGIEVGNSFLQSSTATFFVHQCADRRRSDGWSKGKPDTAAGARGCCLCIVCLGVPTITLVVYPLHGEFLQFCVDVL